MIPVVAVQVAPSEAPAALERRMLEACSAGLRGARCVRARSSSDYEARAIAMVSWVAAEKVSVEVGVGRVSPPLWRTRELEFEPADPALERWRAIGFTIALLVGDETFDSDAVGKLERAPPMSDDFTWSAEARALTGSGLLSGAWRLGAEARLSLGLSQLVFATTSLQYSLATDTDAELDVRWFDASAGVGLRQSDLFEHIAGRVRLELLLENIAVSAKLGGASDQRSAWVPGLLTGLDLDWEFAPDWAISGRADAFLLDGSTALQRAGERVAASAGAGIFLGIGAAYRF